MREGLIGRVKRLVSGSVNSAVDAVEAAAPETVLKEAVREIDTALDEVRHELGKTLADKHHAAKRLASTSEKHEELGEKIEFAVSEGRDDLAQAAIARQLDLEAQIPVLESALRDFSEEETDLEGYIAALTARRREMEDDLDQFLKARADAAKAQAGGATGGSGSTAEDRARKADRAFSRVLKNASGIAGTDPADRETAQKLEELSRIERENRIKERLAKVKAVQKDV
ncbi:MAG: PspA/IM30 family protein [Pseudomonadota bacterium]